MTTSHYSRLDNPYDRLAHSDEIDVDISKDNPHISHSLSAESKEESEDEDEEATLLGQ